MMRSILRKLWTLWTAMCKCNRVTGEGDCVRVVPFSVLISLRLGLTQQEVGYV